MDNSNERQTLGALLQAARTAAGLSVRELARLTGVGHPYLVKLENGQKTNPSADILQKLADALELDAGELLAYIGVKPASVLPSATVYFRKKFGMSDQDAARAAQLIENYTKEKTSQENKGGEHDQP